MDTVEMIIRSSTSFYNDLKIDENGRYRSWEHCYSNFCHAREKVEVDCDYLSLQLAFYLASWGMYRGSSFLLQKDYKIHIPVVKELLQKKHRPLVGIACKYLKDANNQRLLNDINNYLMEYYDTIRKSVKEQEVFYEKNADRLEPVRKGMVVYDLPYPQMKMLDMGFGQIGFDLDTQKGLKVAH